MGLFGGLFESNSSSSQKTSIRDERQGAEGGDAIRIEPGVNSGVINIGSDDVALTALEINRDIFGSALTNVLNQSEARATSADKNIQAAQNLAGDIIAKGQESADDRLIKLIGLLMAGTAGIMYIKARA